ncbi:MAG: NTP transferase domain-containing protein [Desulfovibrio sp.]|jgi:spore coat polysaccharide biosynthesis protein SpsF|nr:NTP transferase domain-containing protein [Desulfovibrio sp.]
MYVIALIQARMGSSRLPCKMMLSLHGLPVIDWVVKRCAKARLADRLIVAVPDAPLDDVLHRHLQKQNVAVFRGPENDVLKRFVMAANEAAGGRRDVCVLRVCADNPLIWGPELDKLIACFARLSDKEKAYAYNHIPLNNLYPDGLGAEIVSLELLRMLDRKAEHPGQREHCLSYILDNPGEFGITTFDPEDPRLRRPDIKLDLDTPEDFRRLSLLPIYPEISPPDIIALFPPTH